MAKNFFKNERCRSTDTRSSEVHNSINTNIYTQTYKTLHIQACENKDEEEILKAAKEKDIIQRNKRIKL